MGKALRKYEICGVRRVRKCTSGIFLARFPLEPNRFNFNGEHENNEDKQSIATEPIQWFDCEEVLPDKQIDVLDNIVEHAKMFITGDVEIGHVVTSDILGNILCNNETENATELAEKNHSDLVMGKYEGGLKIWECTYDLINYLVENQDYIKFASTKVLDLGCGAGILGIYALMNGSLVTFQDYNKEVIEHVTIPNVLLNIEEEERKINIKKCSFFSGDWASFNLKLNKSELYDVILTSETIYNECNYDKLIDLFTNRLNKNGTVYVAAKTCYFGVGGGVRSFEQKLKKAGSLQCAVCWKSSGGIQREILKITHNL